MDPSTESSAALSNLIKKVRLDSHVYEVLINHALSNEKEENMGLLIGNVEEIDCLEQEKYIINVQTLILLERMDKRQDRVEISPEQLSNATEYAEKLSKQTSSNLRIIGWYHSHPNITVWPSHVDIKTQSMYQMMGKTDASSEEPTLRLLEIIVSAFIQQDRNFVGLILSVFNDNHLNNLNTVELVCFQSNEKLESMFLQIPVEVVALPSEPTVLATTLDVYSQIPALLIKEENSIGAARRRDGQIFALMSDIGIYLHSASRIVDTTYLQTINSLKCREIVNNILINFNHLYLKRLHEDADKSTPV